MHRFLNINQITVIMAQLKFKLVQAQQNKQILKLKLKLKNPQMQSKKCHGCDRSSHSLFTANCGHKTCFYCYKNNKPGHKCKRCNEKVSHSLSPVKNKSAEKPSHLMSQQTKPGGTYSPIVDSDRGRISGRSNKDQKQLGETLICLEHRQPLNMFCKSTKQILCSVCLCRKNKYSQQILPLRSAQQYLRKQNKSFREQARIVQTDVQSAWRIVNKNRQILEQTIQNHTLIINEFFDNFTMKLKQMQENSIRLCKDYLVSKINQYGEISDDLTYLSETLKQYRQNSSDTNNINELAYFYTSFSVIKKTLQSLTFDYIPYDKKEIMLIDLDRELSEKVQRQLIKFRLNLQIKTHDKHKSRSASIKSAKNRVSPDSLLQNKHKISDQHQHNSNKKHKFSLCSNVSVQYDNEDGNLYKKLLKSKYKF